LKKDKQDEFFECIRFSWIDYFFLFFTQVVCGDCLKLFKKQIDKEKITRNEVLGIIYEKGLQKV